MWQPPSSPRFSRAHLKFCPVRAAGPDGHGLVVRLPKSLTLPPLPSETPLLRIVALAESGPPPPFRLSAAGSLSVPAEKVPATRTPGPSKLTMGRPASAQT